MKTRRIVWLGLAVLLLGAALPLSVGAGSGNHLMRWDIIRLSGAPPTIHISAGGTASALANDGSKITLTGSGTFRSNGGRPQDVSGGGTWTTYASGGAQTATGSYAVSGFVSYVPAPGAAPSPPFVPDITGNADTARAGLAVFRIAYSDGSEGVLVVSCHLPTTTIDSIFEGVTASKGYTDYWNRQAPFPAGPPFVTGENENRTQFNVLR